MSFRLLLVVLWRIVLSDELFEFRAKHSGVSNPSLGLSYRASVVIKVTFVVYFYVDYGFLQLGQSLTLFG